MTIVGQLLPVYARPASTGDVASTGLEMLNEVTPGLGFVEPVVRPTGMLPHEKVVSSIQPSKPLALTVPRGSTGTFFSS